MSTPVYNQRIPGPSAWTSKEVSGKQDFAMAFDESHLQAIDRVLERTRHIAPQAVTRADFTDPALDPMLARLAHEIMEGKGLVVVQGVTRERYSEEDFERIYWGIGTHLGEPAPQIGNEAGHDQIGRVRYEKEFPNPLGYRSHSELTMHCDPPELVGLMCVRQAKEGGYSLICNALAIHNEILATRPGLLEPLYRGFPFYRLGHHMPGEPQITPYNVPVFANVDGVVSCHFGGGFRSAEERGGTPMPADFAEALDYFYELSKKPEFYVQFLLEPGEMALWDNCTLLHARTSFTDGEDEAHKRYLLRLWLDVADGRPVVAEQDICAAKSLAARGLTRTQFEAA